MQNIILGHFLNSIHRLQVKTYSLPESLMLMRNEYSSVPTNMKSLWITSNKCGMRTKIKAQYCALPWRLVKWGRPQWPNYKFPSLFCSHRQNPPAKQPFLSRGPGIVPACLWAVGFSCLSINRIFQANRSLLWEPEAPHPLDTMQPAFGRTTAVWPCLVCGVLLLQLWQYVSGKLLSMASVQCQVLCVQPFL